MSGFLLDTHVVLWWLAQPERLTQRARTVIADGHNRVFVSAAAVWEMTIKQSIGRLSMPDDLLSVLGEERVEPLFVTARHALGVAELPWHHQDPFDRIQIAQAHIEQLTLLTRDPQIRRYDIDVIES